MNAAPSRFFRRFVHFAAAAVAIVFTVALGAAALAPRGEMITTTDLTRPVPFISEPKPSDRLDGDVAVAEGAVRLTDSPVYLDVSPPADFDRVTMKVFYENPGGATIELGAKASGQDNQFEMRPAEMRLVDVLDWHRVSGGRLTLLERRHEYASIDDFLAGPPAAERVAAWLAGGVPAPFRLAGYSPSDRTREIGVSLRGHHRLWTYVKDEPLNFSFTVQDMNRSEGADPAVVTVYSGGSGEPLATARLEDDGNAFADQHSSGLRTVAVSLTSPPEGAYQVEFTASDDVFIRRLATRQSKLVFADRLYLGDYVGYSDRMTPAAVFVSGSRLAARTAHAEGVQTVDAGGATLEVAEPNVLVSARLPSSGLLPVVSPRRDVVLETDGWFAFSREEMFVPAPRPAGWDMTAADLDAGGIDFFLTSYEPPRIDGQYKEASVEFRIADLVRTGDGAYRFAISVPGAGESDGGVRLSSVSFVWKRDSSGWRDAWHRLVRTFTAADAVQERVEPFGRSFGEEPL